MYKDNPPTSPSEQIYSERRVFFIGENDGIFSLCRDSEERAHLLGFRSLKDAKNIIKYILE